MATNNSINNTAPSGFTCNPLNLDPGASGDSYIQFDINTTNEWRIGVDDNDADAFVFSQGGALGTNNFMHVTASGEITLPSQPSFLAYLGSADTDVTGNGTTYTIGTNTALTEVIDRGGDFNTNGTFTAPVTGRYQLYVCIGLTGLTSLTSMVMQIVTSNRTYQRTEAFVATALNQSLPLMSLCDMDSADTATATIAGSGDGADTADLNSTATFTYYGGFLSV